MIGNLKELVYLDASCNRIESLPLEVEGLSSLTDLHLSKNYLQELPKTIGKAVSGARQGGFNLLSGPNASA